MAHLCAPLKDPPSEVSQNRTLSIDDRWLDVPSQISVEIRVEVPLRYLTPSASRPHLHDVWFTVVRAMS